MIAEIQDNQHVYFSHITHVEEDILWVEFSVTRPNRYIDPTQLGNWDGVFRKYNRAKKRIARPLLDYLKKICAKKNLMLDIVDKRKPWKYEPIDPEEIKEDFLPGITLAEYQINAIKKAVEEEVGIIDLPTGAGKTEVLSGICKAIQCPTIILADQTIVVDQIKQRLELRDVTEEVGLFYAGKRPNGQLIVVGSIQSLSAPSKVPEYPTQKKDETDKAYAKRVEGWERKISAFETRKKNAKVLLKYVQNAEMIIVDECDRAVSDAWKSLFRYYVKARRRYGVSGTPYDPSKPVEAMVLQEHLGSIIVSETRQHITDLGRIIPCEYFMVGFGLDGSISDSTAYDIAYDEQMTNNPKYYHLLKNICKKYSVNDDGTLVIVEREAIGLRLKDELCQMGIKADFIYGKTPKAARNEAFRAFERREIQVLIGGKIINRGLDLAGGCETMVLACGGKLRSEFLQKIGRALRRNKKGKSKVFDVMFRNNKYLYNHSKERLKTMIDAGYPTKIVLPKGIMPGEDFISSRYRIPKKYLV